MSELRRTWPLASILFVTLAGADIASADKASSSSPATPTATATTTAEAKPVSLRLFGRTWCLGQPPAVTCDVRLPPAAPEAREAAVTPAADPATADRPFHRFLQRMKQLFGAPEGGATRG
jgi:hypothetical protein